MLFYVFINYFMRFNLSIIYDLWLRYCDVLCWYYSNDKLRYCDVHARCMYIENQ